MIEFNGELTFKNEALKVGKQTFSFSINIGLGTGIELGEDLLFKNSKYIGFGFGREVYAE